ncbi:hypothetical protein HZH66_000089 [Vespula vulgaris]|uniref:SYO1-like TPR repeats domain-containing protein n=1 Tax=Vespula vulgaris TaxID=7454 RepID=A0A834KQQ0_VESVU|nr:HEAT repeat-containing protein 3 [Vespula vulgaris]KAF7411193.1 hypothetical protein HZH66_000089 [Vespula vulgaris]
MGKQKRQRRKPHKENPTGFVSTNHFEEIEDFTNVDKEEALQKVYEEVQSSILEEKLSGLQTLESMSCSKSMAERIAMDGIAKILGPLLIDHSIPVRASVASTLRHIVENGGEKACTKFVNDDIMTPLSTLLKRDYREWQPKLDCAIKGKICDEKETFIQAITLLWSLCENNEVAIKHVNELDLMSILLPYFDIATYGTEISIVVAQCILALSEDNPIAFEELKEYEQNLLNLLNLKVNDDIPSCDMVLLKTLVSGILMNINSHTESNKIHIVSQVINVLSETLVIDNINLSCNLSTTLSEEKEKFSRDTQKKIREFRKLLGAQQQALEILTNLCSEDQENELYSEIDDSEQIEGEEPMDDDESTSNNFCQIISSLPVELIEVISNSNLLKKIWNKTTDINNVIRESFSQSIEGRTLLKQIHLLRCRAYLCLHNFISILDISMLGGVENLYSTWCEIGTIVFKDADMNDIELLESATAALRAILQKLTEVQANTFSKLTVADIQPMLNGERHCPNANIRANLIRILGNLALIIFNNDNLHKHDLMKHISVFLLVTCATEPVAWVIGECLDALMDIFSEDETDKLAGEIQLTVKLRELIPIFKNKVREQKKTLGDNVAVISTVNTNIIRFIKYKEKRIKHLK